MAKLWIVALRRQDWSLSRFSVVCRMHFSQEDNIDNGLLQSAKVQQQAYGFNMKPHHFGISNTTLGSTCSSIYRLRNKRHGSV
ncbi:hypothetical protein Pcinc_038012 [Petrolisthes cinctipes]|uniref:THAP-type domain-containing protein n=1 Tax=Petrolisthes cinctipes TaxID=88211 RepID=A0AAE1EKG2_PETCI|nr:hypothetical protein Pcinc_038012 [Petrolisthes cinctipes]